MIGHTEPNKDDDLWAGWYVLILVLMEDTLGVAQFRDNEDAALS